VVPRLPDLAQRSRRGGQRAIFSAEGTLNRADRARPGNRRTTAACWSPRRSALKSGPKRCSTRQRRRPEHPQRARTTGPPGRHRAPGTGARRAAGLQRTLS